MEERGQGEAEIRHLLGCGRSGSKIRIKDDVTPDRRVGVWHHLAIQFMHHGQSSLGEGVSFWRMLELALTGN